MTHTRNDTPQGNPQVAQSSFIDVSSEYSKAEGGSRHVRTLSENCWISVLHRMTGFGFMEWETAICFRDQDHGKSADGSPYIVRGDWRDELETMPEDQLLSWYESKKTGNRTAFDAFLDAAKEAAK